LINPTLTAGRWLLPEDENAMVIGNHLTKARPDLKVGDEIKVKIDNQDFRFKIVGIFRMAGNNLFPPVFVKYDYLASRLGATDKLSAIRVVTSQHDAAFQENVGKQLEQIYIANDVDVQQYETGSYIKQINTATTDILINFLLLMAVFIAIVGGFGLASTMSLNVIERIREIGVMRAIGASSLSIQGLVLVEGILIGILSWLLGALFAIPVGQLLSQIVGITIVQSPLTFVFAWDGFLVWLVMIMIISALASGMPARTASRLTVREVLAYE
jgi:putative ABC transport system permease protein